MVKLHKIDVRKASEGVWTVYDDQPEISFLIARLPNPRMAAWVRATRPERMRQLREEMTTDAASEAISNEAMSQFVLLGWKGLDGDDGQPLAYSPEAALQILSDARTQHVRDFIVNKAAETGTFLEEEIAAAGKASSGA